MGRRRKQRYAKTVSARGSLVEIDSPEQLRKEFPEKLISAYVAVVNSKFDEKLHRKYQKLADKFLGTKAEDRLESIRLVVRLTKATFDLVESSCKCKKHQHYKALRKPRSDCVECWAAYNEKNKTKKETQTEEESELACGERPISQSGSDEGQEEGSE